MYLGPDPSVTLLWGDLGKPLPLSVLWFAMTTTQTLSSRPFLSEISCLPVGLQCQQPSTCCLTPDGCSWAQGEALLTRKPLYFPSWICASLMKPCLSWGSWFYLAHSLDPGTHRQDTPTSRASSGSQLPSWSSLYFQPAPDGLAIVTPTSLLCGPSSDMYLGSMPAPLYPSGLSLSAASSGKVLSCQLP